MTDRPDPTRVTTDGLDAPSAALFGAGFCLLGACILILAFGPWR